MHKQYYRIKALRSIQKLVQIKKISNEEIHFIQNDRSKNGTCSNIEGIRVAKSLNKTLLLQYCVRHKQIVVPIHSLDIKAHLSAQTVALILERALGKFI